MRTPFLKGSSSPGDPNHQKLWVTQGNIPQPIPGPWTLQAVIQPEDGESDAAPSPTPAVPQASSPPQDDTPAP